MEAFKIAIVNKRFLIILFLGMISGTLFANFYGTNHISDWGIFDNVYMEKYNTITINYPTLWKYVAQDRIRDIIFLSIISLTSISVSIFMLYLFYIGIGIGLVVSMATMQYGIFGLWIYVVSIFPQYIFYGLAFYIIANNLVKNKKQESKKPNYRFVVSIIISCLLVLLGTCTEAFINPSFMKNIIYNMY